VGELDAVAERAHAAFRGGWAADGVERARCLNAWADGLELQQSELAAVLVAETGKIRREAEREVALSVDALRYNAGLCRHIDGLAATMADGSAVHVIREPLGACAFIVPWNWPVFLLMRDLAPALAAGATAVIKPAPQAPQAIERALEIGHSVGVPEGVTAIVHGDGDTGHALVSHPRIRAVSFTGSTHVGRVVAQTAARDFKPALLELGGKGVSVVFGDADLEDAVDMCVASALITSGQMCMASARLLVEAPVYQDVVDAVCARVAALTVGPPEDPATDQGPVISPAHLERVWSYIELGRDWVVAGGRRATRDLAPGNYLEPTVLVGDDLPDKILTEEIFGPVLTIEPFAGEADAVAKANSSPYGLAASVWTKDAGRGWRTARLIEAGTVWVNRYNRMYSEVPSGGMKDSGIGRTRGIEGMLEFTELKHINWNVG
jgi:acyl-CoA reductase-like NAD-dependent aldehyde dehydrogenase